MMPLVSKAQNVGINNDNTTPASSAMLDVKSTNKGLLIPRMTTGERTAIVAPANGLMVYDITTNTFWFYKNTAWSEVTAALTLPYLGTNTSSTFEGSLNITNLTGNAIAGTSEGVGAGIRGFANGTGMGVYGQAASGNAVEGFSGSGIGGYFYTDGDKPGVYATSSDGIGGKFEGANDSAGVMGIGEAGPGGEFKSLTGPAIKAHGNVEVNGAIKIQGGGPAAGKVLTATDTLGNAAWASMPYGNVERFCFTSETNPVTVFSTIYNTGTVTTSGTAFGDVIKVHFPVAGLYHFDVNTIFNGSSSGSGKGILNIERSYNSISLTNVAMINPSGSNRDCSIDKSFDLYMSANSFLEFHFYQSFGGATSTLFYKSITVTGHLIAP